MSDIIARGYVIENSAAVMLARVSGQSGGNVVQADISSINVKVFDLDNATQISTTITPTVSSVVYNTLQTDARWTVDATGYNVAIALAGSYFPEGNRPYSIEAKFTPASGSAFYVVWQVESIDILSE
jgi:hypothetical protein